MIFFIGKGSTLILSAIDKNNVTPKQLRSSGEENIVLPLKKKINGKSNVYKYLSSFKLIIIAY